MAFRALVGQLTVAVAVVVGLVAFFALLPLLSVVLSPLGFSDQAIAGIAAVVFFGGFWAIGLKLLLGR
ncbi:hypothetical protein [Halopiger goleimassiliensis]|uniref:hypothetical protein n=1 Tax=Halopiger goleimassiliensis TaxID=1293048 RepID=UPI0006780E57|nr:hypothetical protein [Halopiger goleimassiliensis]